MTDWLDVRRDGDGDWVAKTGRCPNLVMPVNGQGSYAEWGRAAEFCRAVADAMRAEVEAEGREREREFKLRVALVGLAKRADAYDDPIGEIIRTVREHDA